MARAADAATVRSEWLRDWRSPVSDVLSPIRLAGVVDDVERVAHETLVSDTFAGFVRKPGQRPEVFGQLPEEPSPCPGRRREISPPEAPRRTRRIGASSAPFRGAWGAACRRRCGRRCNAARGQAHLYTTLVSHIRSCSARFSSSKAAIR